MQHVYVNLFVSLVVWDSVFGKKSLDVCAQQWINRRFVPKGHVFTNWYGLVELLEEARPSRKRATECTAASFGMSARQLALDGCSAEMTAEILNDPHKH